MFLNFVSIAVFLGAFVWLAYIAIEPIVRRRWPELLFSWSRLLSGRFRDPLVGRDVLAGILIGALMMLLLEAASATPNWVDLAGMTPMPPSRATMLSAAGAASRLFSCDLRRAVERARLPDDPRSEPGPVAPQVAGRGTDRAPARRAQPLGRELRRGDSMRGRVVRASPLRRPFASGSSRSRSPCS